MFNEALWKLWNDDVAMPRPHLIEIDLTRKMLVGELKRSSNSSPRLLILTPTISRFFRPACNVVCFGANSERLDDLKPAHGVHSRPL